MHELIPHHIQNPLGSSNRSFGLVFASFFLIVGILPLLHEDPFREWSLALALIFLLLALFAPRLLGPLNQLWTKFGILLHSIISPIALGLLFFGVIMPIGLLMRLLAKDPLRLRFDKSATTYWVIRNPPGPIAESLKNQF